MNTLTPTQFSCIQELAYSLATGNSQVLSTEILGASDINQHANTADLLTALMLRNWDAVRAHQESSSVSDRFAGVIFKTKTAGELKTYWAAVRVPADGSPSVVLTYGDADSPSALFSTTPEL